MTRCGTPPGPGASVVTLTLAGSGEGVLRMEKRLHCAAAALGLALSLEVQKDYDSLGISAANTPALVIDGQVALSGLHRTEFLQEWLRETFQRGDARHES